jgi:hypothetical protein
MFLVNDAIIERLSEGSADSVRRLQGIGFTPFWLIERTVDETGQPVDDPDPEKPLPKNHRLERFSLWHWSHRAASAEGVQEWWPILERALRDPASRQPHRMLADHLGDAIAASAWSGETAAVLYSWDRSLRQKVPQWGRKILMNRLLDSMEAHGNRLVPLLVALHQSDRLTDKDWSVAQRPSYAQDPVTFLFQDRAWDALHTLLAHGADPVLRNGAPLVTELLQDLAGTPDAVDPGRTRLLGTLLARQTEALSSDQTRLLTMLSRRLARDPHADPTLVAELDASSRAQAGHTVKPVTSRRRQRS